MGHRILRIAARIALFVLALIVVAVAVGYWLIHRQGAAPGRWAQFPNAKVRFDPRGIPTIEARTWPELIEAEGYVVASERLFQMDLMRRAAGGRLSEWLGPATIGIDRARKLEDWEGVAERGYEILPPDEKSFVDAYARGVNRFIQENRWRWGIEYLILRAEPAPWEGKDTLLVVLSMDEQLTAYSGNEAATAKWRAHLDDAWAAFILPEDHPWNQPLFGKKRRDRPPIPWERALPMAPLDASEKALPEPTASLYDQSDTFGASNNWAWCGKTGCFLANDPHLGATVPHIWYALRLRTSPSDWVVGVALPGVPGIILGMNPHLAWAFTNVGEDVDDLLEEELSPDGTRYIAERKDGEPVFKPIVEKKMRIAIRGAPPEEVTARFTHRGPLVRRAILGDRTYSRQWLALKEGFLRFPIQFNRATSWDELNRGLDDMRAPAQNVLVVDRRGNVGYRTSGTGVIRKTRGDRPLPALEGEWLGYAPSSARPRILLAPAETSTRPRFLATANQRIWVDDLGHHWAEDLRQERIRRALSSRADFSRQDMEQLQRDTESRYHRLLLGWVAERAAAKTDVERTILERWRRWSGVAIDDADTFTDALGVDRALNAVCLGRVKSRLFPTEGRALDYPHWLRTAWIITMLETPGAARVFGLDEIELANHLLQVAVQRAEKHAPPYFELNRWAAQHPYAGRLPLLGPLFKVDTPVQHGWRNLVRVEQPVYGASVRMVWDLTRPLESTWSLPVGQSGHIGSPHFHDLQDEWFADRPYAVFDPEWEWSP